MGTAVAVKCPVCRMAVRYTVCWCCLGSGVGLMWCRLRCFGGETVRRTTVGLVG